jgi:predicted amidohydrolase YtcJ
MGDGAAVMIAKGVLDAPGRRVDAAYAIQMFASTFPSPLQDGVVREAAAGLRPEGDEQVVDAGGRWAVPGLWDQHVHMVQWAQTLVRLDLSGTANPSQVTRLVGEHIAQLPAGRGGSVVCGYGYRSAIWAQQPTVVGLDAVSAGHPAVLISGDGHNGWLNTRTAYCHEPYADAASLEFAHGKQNSSPRS